MAQRKIYFNIVDKIVIVIMAIVCIIVGIFRFTQHPVIVVGSSMYPTYTEGDILTTDIHFTPDDIHYDSIIAFDTHKKYHALYIKRVVGLPGDTVRIQNGILYINEEKENMPEPTGKETVRKTKAEANWKRIAREKEKNKNLKSDA